MNIFQRIALKVAGIQTESTKALQRPIWFDMLGSYNLGKGGQFESTDTGLVGAMRSNVWAYNSVKARMTMIATPKLKLYKGFGKDRVEIEKHPVIDLLRDVNPINLNARSFMRGIEQQLSVFGRCIIHKNRGSRSVAELYILPKPYIEVVPDQKIFIAGYRWLPTGEIIEPKDIIDLYYPAADGSVEAESPTAVALGSINGYNLADKAQRAIDRRGGQKGGILIHPKEEIIDDFYRTKEDWDKKRSDPDQAGSDMHVPYGTDYKGDAFSAIEMQREERIQRLAKEIMAAYSMPPAAAGDYTDASVLANAAVQMKAAWDLHGIEELNFIAEGLTNELLWAEYKGTREGDMHFDFDLSTISALDEDTDAKIERAGKIYGSQIGTLNEARAIAGLEPVKDKRANQLPLVAGDAVSTEEDEPEDPEEMVDEIDDSEAELEDDGNAGTPLPTKAGFDWDTVSVLPIVDPVGRTALDLAGNELGQITKVARFNIHNGIEATAGDPVVYVGDKVFKASTVRMVLNG